MKDNFSIHEWQLNEKIKGIDGKPCWKGYRYAGTENGKDKCVPVNEASAVYTDWDEYVNPDYILVTLKNGRKLKIEKKHIKGGQRVYQAILQAFNDDKHQITDKLVTAMVKQLGGENIKEIKVGDKVKFKTKDASGSPLYGGKTLKVVSKDGKRWILKGNGFQTDATERELEIISENEDHEVSMAQASLKSIISNASQLMNKLGNDERNIPGWIQDHIINAENYIDQANQGFHELDNEYEED
jgi:hypothetical protein